IRQCSAMANVFVDPENANGEVVLETFSMAALVERTKKEYTVGPPGLPGDRDPALRFPARWSVLPFDDGWLIGADAGEHGGEAWWQPKHAPEAAQLSRLNIQALYQRDEHSAIAVYSLAHFWDQGGSDSLARA